MRRRRKSIPDAPAWLKSVLCDGARVDFDDSPRRPNELYILYDVPIGNVMRAHHPAVLLISRQSTYHRAKSDKPQNQTRQISFHFVNHQSVIIHTKRRASPTGSVTNRALNRSTARAIDRRTCPTARATPGRRSSGIHSRFRSRIKSLTRGREPPARRLETRMDRRRMETGRCRYTDDDGKNLRRRPPPHRRRRRRSTGLRRRT